MTSLTLNGTQQVTVEKVCVTDEAASARWAKWSISVNQSAWTSSAHIQLQTVKNWTIALQSLQLYCFVYRVMFLVCSFSLREFTLDLSAEMPYEISSLQCITHQIKMKVFWLFIVHVSRDIHQWISKGCVLCECRLETATGLNAFVCSVIQSLWKCLQLGTVVDVTKTDTNNWNFLFIFLGG